MRGLKDRLSGLKIDWKSLLMAFLITCFVWLMHNLSGEYSSFFQFKVHVTTNMVGYAPVSVANENLLVRGSATGFYMLRANNPRRGPVDVEIALDERYFHRVQGEEELFEVRVPDVRDKIVESLGDDISVDFLETEQLTFNFTKSSYRKVPVVPSTAVSFKSQYMQVGEIVLKPDSVLVYGPEKALGSIEEVVTSTISHSSLSSSVQGYVTPVQLRDLRIDADKIHYSIRVERYVEFGKDVVVRTVHVPSGKSLLVLPSQVRLTFRVPYGTQKDSFGEGPSVLVDYRSFEKSRSSKMIPVIDAGGVEIYSYSVEPKMVDCILVDDR